jgi:hypothetical protein
MRQLKIDTNLLSDLKPDDFITVLNLLKILQQSGSKYQWSPYPGLNRRPLPYQGSALPLSYMGINIFRRNLIVAFSLIQQQRSEIAFNIKKWSG